MLRQSFAWWTFAGRGLSDQDLLQKAKAIGYAGVEMLAPALFDRALDLGLAVATHQGQQSLDQGWNDPAQHPRLESELHSALALAQKYQIPNLIVFSGNRRPGLSEEAGLENTVLGLSRSARAAEDAGVTLVMELLSSKGDHPGYQCDRTPWGIEVCRRVGSARVKLLYDIYHMQIMEGDLIRTIQTGFPEFGHYHTAGNPGRHDLDQAQEIHYPPIFQAIAATGYTGFVGHEFIPKGGPAQALQAAYDLCRLSLSGEALQAVPKVPPIPQAPPIPQVQPSFSFARPTSGSLPPAQFGELVGTFDHATLVPEGATRPDNNHVYLWIKAEGGAFAGLYECAFNIHSTDQSDVLFTDWPEKLTGTLPPDGFTQTPLSYAALGLQDSDFAPVQQGDLQTLVTHYAETCILMAAYGTTYSEGTGLHDIHLNSGEEAGSAHADRQSQDGALVFYFSGSSGAALSAHWIFVKFGTQSLS